ncbi:P-loop containing nucleoside triphosphate hydrolase protein [Suillus ampliporus]|nr:P-loop containing nucleoside triphosphate hydrolase protein [Suillus ampliporus]
MSPPDDRPSRHSLASESACDPSVDSEPQPLQVADQDISDAIFVVVMGVSGTGKSTLGVALSEALRFPFIDGDDLHPQSNVDKMSRGEPLTDVDRQPWLEIIRETAVGSVLSQLGVDHRLHVEPDMPETEKTLIDSILRQEDQPSSTRDKDKKPGIIIACSALKGSYRSVLRGEALLDSEAEVSDRSGGLPTWFVYMKGSREVLMDRMTRRQGHFMKAAMLDSQLKTLESPESEERVVTVSIEWSTEDQVRAVVQALRGGGEGQQHMTSTITLHN